MREAVEYALDRPAIAKTLGFGKFEALTQIVPSASPAYVPGYDPRPYNPEKARQLLSEAGYPSGFETKLLTVDYARDAAIAVQSYLAAVGIRVSVDVADLGRYYGSLFGPAGWDDLAIARSGINPDATDLFVHFGPRPMTYRFGFIAKSPEFLALCEKALKTYDQAGVRAALKQAVKQGAEERHGDSPLQVCPGERDAGLRAYRLHEDPHGHLVFVPGLDGKKEIAPAESRRDYARNTPAASHLQDSKDGPADFPDCLSEAFRRENPTTG